ncbi:MAG TPA: hypothetical protein VN580_03520, partial [Clostridia bacterium]|nr:hypothetical protein [Clostridia bacterium]
NVSGNTTEIQLKLDKTEYTGLGDRITIQAAAPHLNLRSFYAELMEIKVSTSEDSTGFIINARETKTDSGVFEAQLSFSLGESSSRDGIIKVKAGTRIFVKYQDIIKEAVWKPDDGILRLNKAAYSGYGDQPLITLKDNDLNLRPDVKEQITVTAKSLSDPSGISVKLVEKSADSGIFTGVLSFDPDESEDAKDRLKIAYNDTFTVSYKDTFNTSGKPELRESASTWKPFKGTVSFSSTSYKGLKTAAAFSVIDQDLNLRPSSIDPARVRISSDSDPAGFIAIAYETGANTGVFSGSIRFNTGFSDGKRGIIKVKASDKIYAKYIDDNNSEAISDTIIAAAAVQFTEATIETSAVNDAGSGNMLDIFINEPDANDPDVKDTIVAKAGSGTGSDALTVYLQETEPDSGIFKGSLYFTDEDTHGQFLNMSGQDTVNILYVDNTVPSGGTIEISKRIGWDYQSTILTMDKTAYYGYNTTARISLFNMELNDNSDKFEYIYIDVFVGNSEVSRIILRETSADSGRFEGKLYFKRNSAVDKSIIRMKGNSLLTLSYTNKGNRNDVTVCRADWSPQNAQLALDKQEYSGEAARVVITLKDWDVSNDSNKSDKARVRVRKKGSAKETYITLEEVNSNSDTYTGAVYINGGGFEIPSIELEPGDVFEVIYTDEDTESGAEEERTASAVWIGF